MEVTIYCAMCGRSLGAFVDMDDLNRSGERIVRDLIEAENKQGTLKTWSVQKNGANIDVYCSRKCAT